MRDQRSPSLTARRGQETYAERSQTWADSSFRGRGVGSDRRLSEDGSVVRGCVPSGLLRSSRERRFSAARRQRSAIVAQTEVPTVCR